MTEKLKVPKLRFKEFSDEWEEKKLGQVAEIIGGGTPSTEISEYWEGDIQWFTPTEIKKKYVSYSSRTITKEGLEKSSAKLLPKNTILLTTRATLGEMSILKNEATTNQGFQSLKVKCSNYYEFIYYHSTDIKRECYKKASGSTFLEISKKEVEKIKLNIPSLPEQTKIGDFLSMIDKKIELEEKALAKLNKLKKGYMQKIFNQEIRFKDENGNDYPEWEEKKFGEVLKYEQPTKYIVSNTEYNEDYPIPVLTANKTFILGYTDDKEGVYEEECIIFDDFTLESKYVDFPFKVKSTAIKILTSNTDNIYFLSQLIKQTSFVMEGHARHYISIVQNKKVTIPSLPEQTKIANFLSKQDELIEKQEQKIALLKEQKKGLLQQMFV